MKIAIRNSSLIIVFLIFILTGCSLFNNQKNLLRQYNTDVTIAFNSINDAIADMFEAINPEPNAPEEQYAKELQMASQSIDPKIKVAVSTIRRLSPPDKMPGAFEFKKALLDLALAAEKALALNSSLIETAKTKNIVKEKQATEALITYLDSMEVLNNAAEFARETMIKDNGLETE